MIEIGHDALTADDYRRFPAEAGWDVPSEARAATALACSIALAVVREESEPIAMARVVGDGAMNLYIQDVVTARPHRGQGHASALLAALLQHLQERFDPAVTVGLMAAVGQEPLYAKFGFIARPDSRFGAGMIASLGALSARQAAGPADPSPHHTAKTDG